MTAESYSSRTTVPAVSEASPKTEKPQKLPLRGRNAGMDTLTQRIAKDSKFAFENVSVTVERAMSKVKA